MLKHKSIARVSFTIAIGIVGCKTAAPPAPPATVAKAQAVAPAPAPPPVEPAELVLKPAGAAAGAVGMSLVVASPMKLVDDLDALSQSLALPMRLGQSFLPLLTSEAGPGGVRVRRASLERLDAARSVAVVWLVRGPNLPVDWCAALAFKDHGSARDALQGLGTKLGQSQGAIQVRTPSGETVWAGVSDRQLLLSGAVETLLAGGAQAIAAQTTRMQGQALLTVDPAALAKSTGQTLDVLATGVLAASAGAMHKAAGAGRTPASEKVVEAILGALIRPLTQVAVARLSLEIGNQRGVVLRAELQPQPGSDLASKVAHVSPYAFDSNLPVGSDASAVASWGDMASWLAEWTRIMEISDSSGRAAARDLAALFGEASNGGSCVVDFASLPITALCSLTVRPGVQPARVLDRTVAALRSSNVWEAELDGSKPGRLKVKRAGKVVEVEKTVVRKSPQVMAAVKALMGGDVMREALTVKDGSVILAVGPKPRRLLDRYGKPQPQGANAAPILQRTLLDTAGADYLGFVDVMSAFNKLLGTVKEAGDSQLAMMMGAVPGLSGLRVPVVLWGKGGVAPALELQVPFGSLQNVARVVSGFMGQMGAAPPVPQQNRGM